MDRIREKVPMVIVQTRGGIRWAYTEPCTVTEDVYLLPNANLVEFTTGM